MHVRSGHGHAAARHRRADASRRAGRSTRRRRVGRVSAAARRRSRSTSRRPRARRQQRTSGSPRCYRTGGRTGYTDNVVRVVSPVEGRFQRWGKWEEYDNWLLGHRAARAARRPLRRRAVDGHRRDDHGPGRRPQLVGGRADRHGRADAAGQLHGRRGLEAVRPARARRGRDGRVRSSRTRTRRCPATPDGDDPDHHDVQRAGRLGQRGPDDLARADDGDPRGGGRAGARRRGGRRRVRRPGARRRQALGGHGRARRVGVDCGTTGTVGDPATSTYAKVTRHDDDLYVFVHVRDEFQSYAVTPAECVAHWLADSVEILIDPRGTASQTNMDTASTFKLGVFPFTNDPSEHERQRRQRPVLVARRRQPPGLLDRAAGRHGRRRAERARRRGRVERDLGRDATRRRPTTRTRAAATTSRSRSRWRCCRRRSTRRGWA